MENFWAQAFFQIPEFRHKIIESIIHKDDPPLIEWRATEFKLEEDLGGTKKKEIQEFFDWEHHFYAYIDI